MSELQQALQTISSKQTNSLTTLSTNNNTSSDKDISLTVQFESDFQNTNFFKEMEQKRQSIKSVEELRAFRRELNDYSKEFHKNLITKNLPILVDFDYSEITPIEYSPFVSMRISTKNLSAFKLKSLVEKNEIVNISLTADSYEEAYNSEIYNSFEETDTTNQNVVLSWDRMLEELNIDDIVENQSYTGEGIYIGICEAKGVCNPEHINLADKDITINNCTTYTEHATQVTSIIATLSPDASIFVSKRNSNQTALSWFLDQYCDIVNCSYYVGFPTGYRMDVDGIFDYIISTHFLIVACAAGNYNADENTSSGFPNSAYNPDSCVFSPGFAYNAITVGGVVYDGSSWVFAKNGAGYNIPENSNCPTIKPTISAPFT